MSERQVNVDTRVELPSEESDLSVEALFDILGNQYRRFVLSYLAGESTPVRIDELASRVAAWETETTVEAVSTETATDIEILLYHVHLPKMADAGLVTYDADGGIVAPDDGIERATSRLEDVEYRF